MCRSKSVVLFGIISKESSTGGLRRQGDKKGPGANISISWTSSGKSDDELEAPGSAGELAAEAIDTILGELGRLTDRPDRPSFTISMLVSSSTREERAVPSELLLLMLPLLPVLLSASTELLLARLVRFESFEGREVEPMRVLSMSKPNWSKERLIEVAAEDDGRSTS
jgi:hypothetical protein